MSTALPLTGAQAGVWYAQQVEPDGTAFNVAAYLDIRGPVDLDRLARGDRGGGLREAECLHVAFDRADGAACRSSRPATVTVPVLDFRAEPDPAGAAWRGRSRTGRGRWTSRAGPLFAHALLRLADDRVWWYQRYHHIVIDGDRHRAAGRGSRRAVRTRRTSPTVDWPLSRLTDADAGVPGRRSGTRVDRAYWLEPARRRAGARPAAGPASEPHQPARAPPVHSRTVARGCGRSPSGRARGRPAC